MKIFALALALASSLSFATPTVIHCDLTDNDDGFLFSVYEGLAIICTEPYEDGTDDCTSYTVTATERRNDATFIIGTQRFNFLLEDVNSQFRLTIIHRDSNKQHVSTCFI